MEHWGTRLRRILEKRGISKSYALAYQIGVDESAVSRWKRGGPITLQNAVLLSQALEVSLDWLIVGRGDPELLPPRSVPPERLKLDRKIDLLPTKSLISLADFIGHTCGD